MNGLASIRGILLSMLVGLGALCSGAGEAAERSTFLTADATWASKYIVDGFRVGSDSPVWQLSGKADLFSTGFSVMAWTAIQAVRSQREFDELDFFALYSKDLFAGGALATNVHGYYDYWQNPHTRQVKDAFGNPLGSGNRQGNKVNAGVSAIHLLPLAGSYLVPSYDAFYERYWALNRADLYQGGVLHQAKLEYSNRLPRFIPGATWQYYGLAAAGTYNGGVFGVHPGWSHSTATLTTGVYALGSIFELSLNRQWSFEKTVNVHNELWTTLSFIKKI